MPQSAQVPAAPFQSYQAPAQSFVSPVLQEKNLRDVVGKKNLTVCPSSSRALPSFSRPVRGGESQPLPCSSPLQSERACRLCLVPQHLRRGPDLPPQLRETFHLGSHPSGAAGGLLASHHGVPKVCQGRCAVCPWSSPGSPSAPGYRGVVPILGQPVNPIGPSTLPLAFGSSRMPFY